MATKLGSADFAVQVILRAWFETLKTDSQAWENALYKFPDDIVADTRQMFLNAKESIQVISGFPIADDRPPIVSVVMLGETPDIEYMGQMEGIYQSMGEDPVEQVGNITRPQVGIMFAAPNRRGYPQVIAELVKVGCLIAQKAMLDAGFMDMKFESATDMNPQDLYLPQEWWIRAYTYSVMEENLARTAISGEWVSSLVKVALAAILNMEPSNGGGITPEASE